MPRRRIVKKIRKKSQKRRNSKRRSSVKLYEPPSTYTQIMASVEELTGTVKKERGRQPRPPNSDLWGRRGDITNLLEIHWAEVGWELLVIRNSRKETNTPDAVRRALEPLRGKYGSERLAFLLRPTGISATSNDVRVTQKEFGDACKKRQALQQSYDKQLELYTAAERAVSEVSPEHRNELEKSITYRIGTRLQLRTELAQKRKLVEAAQAKLRKTAPESRQTAENELLRLEGQLSESSKALQKEDDIVQSLRRLHAAANPTNRTFARQESEKRRTELESIATELEKQKAEVQRLETLYENQAAGFSRQSFWEFLVNKRADHHPRKLAVGLAGLPEIGCRESVTRCNKLAPIKSEPHMNFQVFEVIDRACAPQRPQKPQPLLELIKNSLDKAPKTYQYSGKRVPRYLHQYFRENWPHLKEAIEMCYAQTPPPPSSAIPYIVTAHFLEAPFRQRTNLEHLRLERTKEI